MTYFFIKEGTVLIQKPNAKLREDFLKDKWTVVDLYMKQNSLSPKNEDDCVKSSNITILFEAVHHVYHFDLS